MNNAALDKTYRTGCNGDAGESLHSTARHDRPVEGDPFRQTLHLQQWLSIEAVCTEESIAAGHIMSQQPTPAVGARKHGYRSITVTISTHHTHCAHCYLRGFRGEEDYQSCCSCLSFLWLRPLSALKRTKTRLFTVVFIAREKQSRANHNRPPKPKSAKMGNIMEVVSIPPSIPASNISNIYLLRRTCLKRYALSKLSAMPRR